MHPILTMILADQHRPGRTARLLRSVARGRLTLEGTR
jgi:hypothetical protein